jgi:hypothetical protein
MNSLINNEILGTIALQATLANTPGRALDLPKVFLILPLMFNKRTRSLIKSNKVKIMGSRDLVLTFPKDFSAVNSHYLDFATTSLNTVLLACELNIAVFEDGTLRLASEIYTSQTPRDFGKVGSEIFQAAPRLAKILEESAIDLYQNFRISL